MDDLVCDGRGWYKTYRQIDEWEWYKTPHMFHIFSHLLNKANFEEKRWEGITVNRGQLVTSRDSLSEQTGISVQSIRTCLERLKSTNEITIKSTNRFTIITITKYDSYQSGINLTNQQINQPSNQQLTNNQPATNHNEEVKKERIEILSSPNGNCPHDEVIALYHKILPMLPQVRKWDDRRKKLLTMRWKEDPEQKNLEFWERFFNHVAKCDFLTGKKTSWCASLEWLIKPSNFLKIIEGNYDN